MENPHLFSPTVDYTIGSISPMWFHCENMATDLYDLRNAPPASPHGPQPTADGAWLAEAREIIADLSVPSPLIYWIDLAISASVGYAGLLLFAGAQWFTLEQAIFYAIAVLGLFRAGSFIHEVVHLRHNHLRAFRSVWNVAFGMPLLIPSFFYLNHLAHHNSHRFGTSDDGEYLPLASGSWGTLLEFLVQVPLMPLWVLGRFLLSPLTFIHPRVRRWSLEHCSSFFINIRSRFALPRNAPLARWAAIELACSLIAWGLVLPMFFDLPALLRADQVYAVAIGILTINYFRTFLAHRYRSHGNEMTFLEQFDDSTTIEGHPLLTELLFPLGLRYHALHHLFPTIPYHNLGIAHRRLMAGLPLDSPYRRTVFPNTWSAARSFWSDFRQARSNGEARRVLEES